jgi:UDPglucose 6-dehydrogenase
LFVVLKFCILIGALVKMKVTVIGTGYVGLVSGACLAELGNNVMCLDIDEDKIKMLKEGKVPIHDPGLEELVIKNLEAKRLHFTTDEKESVNHGAIQFIAVGTPPDEDGSADLQYVLAAAKNIGKHMNSQKIIIDKSTVPVGTAESVKSVVQAELTLRKIDLPFHIVSNPEFLKEGAAVADFMRPDRIIIGADDPGAIETMKELYEPFRRNHDRLVVMDIKSAELTKYAANAMLATRISFMNELALLAEKLGADIEQVRQGIGSDPRIGYNFLYAGCGYGGSCFPKDLSALQKTAKDNGLSLRILEAVEKANENQKTVLIQKIIRYFGDSLSGRHFALWGLAFKPNTDDMREAPSRVLIDSLLKLGATVSAYDPVAMNEAKRLYVKTKGISFVDHQLDAVKNADALVLVTEWKEFRSPDFNELKSLLKTPVIFDGRNVYNAKVVKSFGFDYFGIGRN